VRCPSGRKLARKFLKLRRPALTSSHVGDVKKPPTDLHEVVRDLISIGDREAASRRLVEKLVSPGDVDIVEIAQTQLRLLQAGGIRSRFRIHPQGMEVDGDTGLVYITTVEVIEERDKARQYWGKGRAHLFECNIEGETIRSVSLKSDNEDEYHPSGMVLINGTMFMALSEYGPETSATIIRFNVKDWTYEKLFHIQDHVGLVIPNLDKGELLLGNWGCRHYYCTDLRGNIKSKRSTPCSDNMEHQDAQLLSVNVDLLNNILRTSRDTEIPLADREGTIMLVTGVTAGGMKHFGLDIFDVTSWKIHASRRWPSSGHMTSGGWPPFANSTFLWVDSYDRVLALVTDEQTDEDPKLVLYTLIPRG
jgi:Family of unknown function (DUF6454)